MDMENFKKGAVAKKGVLDLIIFDVEVCLPL